MPEKQGLYTERLNSYFFSAIIFNQKVSGFLQKRRKIMFFIMGISQGRKKLNFDQMIICNNCGKYGHLEVYMIYSYLSFFFIPLIKWGRSYCVRTTCCDTVIPIDNELGKQIEQGEVTSLPESIIPDNYRYSPKKRCDNCGFETEEDFQFCPKCGGRL